MSNLKEDNQSDKRLIVGSIEVLEDITGEGVKVIKQQIKSVGDDLTNAIAQQNDYWSALASDRTITAVEKKTIYKEFSNIQNTHQAIMNTAETLGYLSDGTIVEYNTAYNSLYTYLNTTIKLFDDLEGSTNISSRANFNGYFTNYYDKEFKARVLLSKGNGGGYQDYQFAIGNLDDYPTDESSWTDAPQQVPAGKYLWCRTRWVDAEGYAGQWYTFRIQGTNGSYHDYQFAQGTIDEYPTAESSWTDAPPSIDDGYYLWCRHRYVNTDGDKDDWQYFRIDGSNGGYQDTMFASGLVDSYPTDENLWYDAPPEIVEGRYLWQRTRWVQDGTKTDWEYTRLSGASAGYQNYEFAIGTIDGFIVPIYINGKKLVINESILSIQDPNNAGDWYDAPPAIPAGYYLWCRTCWIDENGEAGEWTYFRMSGASGGYQDYQFAEGDLTEYPTSEDAWTDAPPTIAENKYLWQRTRWVEQGKDEQAWKYTRISGPAGGYQDYQFAEGDLTEYPTSEDAWTDAPPSISEGKYLWQRTRWYEEGKDPEAWTYTRISGKAAGYQDYQFAEGDLTEYPTSEDAWTDAPPTIAENKYLWQRTRWVEDGVAGDWTYTRISGPAGGYQDYQFAEGDLTTYPTDESAWTDAPPSIAENKYLWQRTRWYEEGKDPEAWKYTRISGKAAGYQDYTFAEGDLTTYPTTESAWHDAPPAIAEGKYLWQRTRWVEDGVAGDWTYTRISGAAGGYQDYQFASGDLTTYPTAESSWTDAPPTIAEGKYLWQRTRWVEDGKEEQAWKYTRISGKAAGYQDYQFASGSLTTYPTKSSSWYDAPPNIVDGKYLWQRTCWVEDGVAGDWTYTRLSGPAGGYQDYQFASGDLTTYPTTESSWTDAPPTIAAGKYLWQRTRWVEDGSSEDWTYTRLSGEDADNVIVKFSVNGSTSWHTDFVEGDKYMKVSTDGGSSYTTPAKIVGENAKPTVVQFSVDGETSWHTDFTDGDKYMRISTDDQATWTTAAKIVGENAEEVQTKYSVDGSTDWHETYTDGDKFMSICTDGVNWSNPTKIVGENAPNTVVQFSVDGVNNWHEGFTEGDYFMRISTDDQATWTTAAKIVGEDAEEVQTKYSVDGSTDWHETYTDGDKFMSICTDGVNWSNPTKIVGENAPNTVVQFSVDGVNNWHEKFAEGDYYMRISTDDQATWTDPAKIVGENAPNVLTEYSVNGDDNTWHDSFQTGDYYMRISTDNGATWDIAKIVGEDGGYQDYQFAAGTLTTYPDPASISWTDAPPTIETGKYLWQRTRWVDGKGNAEVWNYTRLSGKSADYQDYQFTSGDLTTYPKTEYSWTDAPPTIAAGKYLWQRTRKVVNDVAGDWTYTRLSAPNTKIEYSADGSTDWHETFANGDYYMRISTDGGSTYTKPAKIVGEDASEVQTKYSINGKSGDEGLWHTDFTDGDKYMIICTDGVNWSNPTKIVGEDAPNTIVEFSIDGTNNWHTDFVDGDYYMRISTDGGITYTKPAKIVGEDAPEIQTKYSVDGETDWHETFTDGDKFMSICTDGETWSNPTRIVGENAKEMKTEYSVDGVTNWHSPYKEGDLYMRVSTDGGETWGKSIRVVGENAKATIAQYSIDGETDWHDIFTDGDYYMRLSVDGGDTWGSAIQIVGEDGISFYVQYSTDNSAWHDPPFTDNDLYMRTRSGADGTWSQGFRIVGESTGKYIGVKNAYIAPQANSYFLAISDFVDQAYVNIVINDKQLIINDAILQVHQLFVKGYVYACGEDNTWRLISDRNNYRYLVCINDLHKYNLDLPPAVEEIFDDHIEPIQAQIDEHSGEITVINGKLVTIDQNLAKKLDSDNYHIPLNLGTNTTDPSAAGEGDFYVYSGENTTTRTKSNVYVYTNGEWIEKDPASNQDGAYYMASLNQILDLNVTAPACFAAVFSAAIYANTAWLNEVHSSIIHLSEYGSIETDNYAAGATFTEEGITAAEGGVGFKLQDANGSVPAYMDMNGYAHFGNDVLIDGKMKATNAEITGTINATRLTVTDQAISESGIFSKIGFRDLHSGSFTIWKERYSYIEDKKIRLSPCLYTSSIKVVIEAVVSAEEMDTYSTVTIKGTIYVKKNGSVSADNYDYIKTDDLTEKYVGYSVELDLTLQQVISFDSPSDYIEILFKAESKNCNATIDTNILIQTDINNPLAGKFMIFEEL